MFRMGDDALFEHVVAAKNETKGRSALRQTALGSSVRESLERVTTQSTGSKDNGCLVGAVWSICDYRRDLADSLVLEKHIF